MWMSGLPAPEAVVKFTECKCGKECTMLSCQCMINKLKCRAAFMIQNCRNTISEVEEYHRNKVYEIDSDWVITSQRKHKTHVLLRIYIASMFTIEKYKSEKHFPFHLTNINSPLEKYPCNPAHCDFVPQSDKMRVDKYPIIPWQWAALYIYIIPCINVSFTFQFEHLHEESYCEISESMASSYMYVYAYKELFLYSHRRARSCTAGCRTGHGRVAQTDAVFIKRSCFLTIAGINANFFLVF